MLLFAVPDATDSLDAIAMRGLQASSGEAIVLHTALDDATTQADATGAPVVVVDATFLSEATRLLADAPPLADDTIAVPHVPPEALRNVAPYRAPIEMRAGGGYVVRPLASPESTTEVALLLIFRRGVWDLPKGKQDPGESIEACAKREVCEEVGIRDLTLHHPLGATQHGYVEEEAFVVKTTAWYLMQTSERRFAPETDEGIRRVAWARWPVARSHIGYDTLAAHMDRVAPVVRSITADPAFASTLPSPPDAAQQ